jgi:hypothetical protein
MDVILKGCCLFCCQVILHPNGKGAPPREDSETQADACKSEASDGILIEHWILQYERTRTPGYGPERGLENGPTVPK